VHLTAWALLVMFIGSNVALTSLESLSEIEITHPLTIIITQNITFVLAALLGVGWGVRRNWQGVTRRLGLSRPRGRDVWLGATMALLMLMSTMLVGALVTIMFGDGLAESTGFNQQIIQQLPGVGGVLLMGFASGIGEELLYRGALQPVARLWLTSLLFALSHIQYLSPAIAIIFVLGLLLGAIRDRWGLNTAIWAHAVYNTLVGLFALLAMNFDQLTFGM
jgi:membrane protease YdiL (CAAX protease family)